MEFSLFNTAAWQLVRQMDWIATLILAGLFILSVLCIAIIASKIKAFKHNDQSLKLLLQRLRRTRNLNDIISASKDFKESIGGKFLVQSLTELQVLLENNQQNSSLGAKLTAQDTEQLEIIINQTIDYLLIEEESYLPILGTSASVAPLVGLFGTIWGLIHAFIDISHEKSADIATVAPGMAEALIITLAGLIVAIPALIAFHYFSNELRKYELSLSELGDKFLSTARQTFLK